MAILKASCDDCGMELDANDIYTDYDNVNRCYTCYLKNEYYYAKSDYEEFNDWLKNTYLKDLAKKKNEMNRLRKEINSLK